MEVPQRMLSRGEVLEAKRRVKNFGKARKSTTKYKKIANLWYVLV